MADYLIKGGTVVDGTLAPAYAADVRVENERIVEIGKDLAARPGEEVFDATGCYVTPGFIESHTHYDSTMWWQPDLDPLPGYGATTIVMGNCGFSPAPLSDDKASQMEMIKIFSFFEDIPLEPFVQHLPFDWRKWSEYKKSMVEKVKLPLNYTTYAGHIAIRIAVMGPEAWDRVSTAEERAKMAELLDDAMRAGALGLSTNLLDHDGENRPIPTLVADDAEFEALFEVLQRYPSATFQCIIDVALMRDNGDQQVERISKLLKGRGIRVQFTGAAPTSEYQTYRVDQMKELVARLRSEGLDVWPGYAHVPLTAQVSIYRSLLFAQSNDYVWHEAVLAEGDAAKEAVLRDPDWRARARESWDTKIYPQSPMAQPHALLLTKVGSENGMGGPFGITLKDYADELGVHASDAAAEWLLRNGVNSAIRMAPMAMNDSAVVDQVIDPQSLGNLNDCGAHLQMLCGSGENVIFLTKYVRDQKLISLEQAIHTMTGKIAEHFYLDDIGAIKPGKRADIVVFDINEIEQRDMEKVYDVEDGKGGMMWRYTRPAAPMRLTMVNGVPIFRDGAYTGAKPGEYLEARNEDAPTALAAE
ncbi:putative D-aminoacylase [Caenibius tardaugens NBRC 16725]|uniref:Putative D-aminoacylase n=1 Tax=Caenibius tardaugens NBRC 16725 TaxID=1219035 RepID=U2Y9U0_9SPHN|nr:amidohydrolase family protein [Caenibius tardaugens]AZI35609.1 D-aminoacylase [Caenibius tardaugens NBRC 16725]GAD50106.1 putative D-aminoacylase [Caenibius tardaugens NBRC 16725]